MTYHFCSGEIIAVCSDRLNFAIKENTEKLLVISGSKLVDRPTRVHQICSHSDDIISILGFWRNVIFYYGLTILSLCIGTPRRCRPTDCAVIVRKVTSVFDSDPTFNSVCLYDSNQQLKS